MKRIINIMLLAAMILALGCSREVVKETVDEAVRVKSTIVESGSYTPVAEFSGTVLALREANLGTALPGRVEKLYYKEGDKVKRGDVIAELSDELLVQAEIEYKTYKKDFERMQRLYDKGSVPEMDYDHIKAQYEAKHQNYEMMRKNTQIMAPFAGTIIKYLVQEGENFLFNLNLEPGYSSTSGIVRLMSLDTVKVEFEVGSSDLSSIQAGQEVLVTVSSYNDKSFAGEITRCDAYLNQMTRTMTAEVELANPDGLLKPGMFASVLVSLPPQQGLFVPLSAVQRVAGTGQDVVYIVNGDKAERRLVTRLFTRGDQVAVSGLQAGQEIVTSGKGKIKSGDRIQVIKGA